MRGRPRRGAACALVALASICASPAPAQEARPGAEFPMALEVPSPLLTVDQERLFSESAFGKRVGREIERRSRDLAAENRGIEEQLVAEEQALTDARATLPVDEFRARAAAFDDKVQRIRAEQDAKTRALATFRDTEQQRFGAGLGEILADIARERGAVAVLDRRVLLISADSIDITADAIAAIDLALGDGAAPARP